MHSPGTILRAAEALLRLPNLHIRLVQLDHDHEAKTLFSVDPDSQAPLLDEPIQISVDDVRAGLIPGVLHETLHIVCGPYVDPLGSALGETCVAALEKELLRRKYFTPGRLRRWRRLIEQALSRSPQS